MVTFSQLRLCEGFGAYWISTVYRQLFELCGTNQNEQELVCVILETSTSPGGQAWARWESGVCYAGCASAADMSRWKKCILLGDVACELDLGPFNCHRMPKWPQASNMLTLLRQPGKRPLIMVKLAIRDKKWFWRILDAILGAVDLSLKALGASRDFSKESDRIK